MNSRNYQFGHISIHPTGISNRENSDIAKPAMTALRTATPPGQVASDVHPNDVI